jgi:hypothetical protein
METPSMPIRVDCPACHAVIKAAEEHAGRRAKCPRCKGPIEVPAVGTEPPASFLAAVPDEAETYALADAAPKARAVPVHRAAAEGTTASHMAKAVEPARSPAEILAAFRGEIRPVRPTLLYRLWILIVAATMVLLPIIYVAIVGLVIFAVGLHAVYDVAIFQGVRNAKAAFLLYVGPLIVGGVVVAFMLKPLFARPGKRPKTRALDPSKEPLLFAFVDGVCTSVGAPTPARVEVDCELNASARRESGALSIFNNELVLTIGLPLVAGLGLKQFAGVLAHEFGHFSQGAGMRLSNLIWTVNAWFARVVYERDEWDETLAAWSSSDNGYEMALGGLARAAVWLTRRILWVLMFIGHAVSGFLSRQMEFDADRYQSRMVGGEVFAETMRRVRELALASQGADADLAAS